MTKKTSGIDDNIKKLNSLITYFEESNSSFDLDEGIEKYEEAMELVSTVKTQLGAYELKIKEIKAKYTDRENQDEEDEIEL